MSFEASLHGLPARRVRAGRDVDELELATLDRVSWGNGTSSHGSIRVPGCRRSSMKPPTRGERHSTEHRRREAPVR